MIENSKKDAHVANALQLISAAKLYEVGNEKIEDGSIESTVLQTEGFLGELINPWTKKSEGYTGTVTKSDGKYSVALAADKCTLNTSEEDLIENGRGACN
ncbi:hypothetical protein ACI2OX_08640 [Bacillus sp. N9]